MSVSRKLVVAAVLTVVALVLLNEPGPTRPTAAPTLRLSGDWFVAVGGSDLNDGRSLETAFATISRAARAVHGGEVVLVAPGTYHGMVKTEVSGQVTRRITFRSLEPRGAKIVAQGAYSAWENRGDYVDIIGFDISGSDYIGLLNYGSHVLVQANEVHDLAAPSCNRPNGGAGIDHANYAAEGNETIGNVVHDIMPPGPYCNLIHGIYHSNKGGVIQNNIVYHVSAKGIQTWHAATGVTIANNLIFDTKTGILIGGDDVKADHYTVTNNILVKNEIAIEELGDRFGNHNVYRNNLLYDNVEDFKMVNGTPVGTVRGNPQMVDFRRDGSGNYRLRRSSPAVDAGTDQGAPLTDIDGVRRPELGGIDIGPYEFSTGETSEGASP